MTFEEGMKQSIAELVEKKTALEKRCFELETENSKLEDINLKLCEQNNELVEEKFQGSLPAFVAAFTKRQDISEKELDEVQRMIDRIRKGG